MSRMLASAAPAEDAFLVTGVLGAVETPSLSSLGLTTADADEELCCESSGVPLWAE